MPDIELAPELARLRERLPDIVAEMERQVPYASALAMRTTGVNITVNNREQQVSPVAPEQGVVLAAWTGEHFAELATGDVDPERLLREAREFCASLPIKSNGIQIDPGPKMRRQFATPCQIDPATVPLPDKFACCVETQSRMAIADRRVVNAQVGYRDETEAKVFANRHKLVTQELKRSRFSLTLFVSDGQHTVYDWRIKDGTVGFEVTELSDEELEKLKQSALALLTAERIEPGFHDCITAPSVSGTIAHEAFGHGVELDMFLKRRARAQDYVGHQVGSPLVNMLDDPTWSGGHGTYFVDDEGQPATPTYIIKDGVLQRGLSDLYSASLLKVPRSANGRRESYQRKTYVRMSNTFFERGESDVQDMIGGVDYGIYCEHASSGMEDPKGWGIQVTCHYAHEVRGGKFTGRVFAPVGITGYVPDVLTSISAVGNDFELNGGFCGKGYKEIVPVSSGGPHLRLRARLG